MSKRAVRSPRERSIFRFIVVPLLGLLAVETVLLVSSVYGSGVLNQLRRNADQMLTQQVENRRNYLESAMVSDWSDLSALRGAINTRASELMEKGELDPAEFKNGGAGEQGSKFLTEITPDLVSALYAKRLSGVFVILNTEDLFAQPQTKEWAFSGICIRDMDPSAPQSEHYADLLLTRAPVSVVKSLQFSTDADWESRYHFDENSTWDFFKEPFEAAYHYGGKISENYGGYWSRQPYRMNEADSTCIAYSQPLMLEDGTVYGVLGVELQTSYLEDQLPAGELFEREIGSYLLAVGEDGVYTPVVTSGNLSKNPPETVEILTEEDGSELFLCRGETYCAAAEPMTLYSNNAPFSDQKWVLIGAVERGELYGFSSYITLMLSLLALVLFVFGIVGSILISRRLATPIQALAKRVADAQQEVDGIPDLPITGIREIDRFSGAIVTLSRDVTEASTRFLRIIDMASIKLGGFELRDGEETIYVTDNFFSLLGLEAVVTTGMTVQRFQDILEEIEPYRIRKSANRRSRIYKMPVGDEESRYLRITISREGDHSVGVAEDVTATMLEQLRIEHERDYDLLTGLYNRRAFYRKMEELFRVPQRLETAALLMIDLDGLKNINDSFGHDFGDQYIRCAGQCFRNDSPPDTLCVRLSGDEFYLFYHGYPGRGEIRAEIDRLFAAIRKEAIALPDGSLRQLSVSGGIAWYPDDSTDAGDLIRYADFAMYQVKRGRKNDVGDFNLSLYNRENNSAQRRREFHQILDEKLLSYHFQPIVDARTGEIRAYEALMRIDAPTLKNPEHLLSIARKEGRLSDVERLTWFTGAETYTSLLEQGLVRADALLFLNSIANQCMTPLEAEQFHHRFSTLQPRIVTEIMEADHMDAAYLRAKREMPGASGLFALDDYGSGYNSEKNLLELAPNFTKVDISIIRDINASRDRQDIVANIVNYTHQRDMQVIAEGVETMEELETVIALGVDLLQGYLLIRPSATPPLEIPADVREVILRKQEEKGCATP